MVHYLHYVAKYMENNSWPNKSNTKKWGIPQSVSSCHKSLCSYLQVCQSLFAPANIY